MTLEETIDRHIRIGLLEHPWLNESLIFEKQGVPDIVVGIVNRLCSVIDNKVKQDGFSEGRVRHFKVTEKDFDGVETFFDECGITITCKDVKNRQKNHGGYNSKATKFNPNTKKIKKANFFFELFFTEYDSAKRLSPLFYHEFTHAYEDYCRLLNSKKSLYQRGVDSEYYRNKENITAGILSACKHIIYFLSSNERNAFMASIRGEIEQSPSFDANQMLKQLKNSRLWNQVKTVEDEIQTVCSLQDKQEQDKAVHYFQDYGYPKIRDYEHLVRNLERYWLEFKEKAGKIAGKQISQVISDMRDGMTDFGMGGY